MRSVVKKITTAFMVVAMAVSFVGCKDKGTAVKDGAHKVEILMNAGSSKKFWEERVQEFNKTIGKENGIEIVLDVKVDANYNQAIEIATQSDQLPDFFSYGTLKELSELDKVVPLNELDGTDKALEDSKDYLVEGAHKIGDKVYSLPSGMTLRGLVYNKDMFKAAGIVDENGEADPPETYDEMVEDAKKLTNESKMQYGIIFPVKWASWVASDILDASAPSEGTDGYNPVTGEFDYTVAEPLIDAIMQIKKDGSNYPGAEGMDNDPARAKFSEGQIGMKFAYSFDVGVFNDQFEAKCDWGVVPLPVKDKDNCYKQYAAVGSGLRVSRRGLERHGKEIMSTVFNYLYSDDIYTALYEEGYSIPYNWDIVKNVEPKTDKKNWKEFCALAEISIAAPNQMPTNMDGLEKIDEAVVNDIWTGKSSVKSVLERCTDIKNKAVEEYRKLNPNQDYTIYINEGWDSKR